MKTPAFYTPTVYNASMWTSFARIYRHNRTPLNPNGVPAKTSLGSPAVRIEDNTSEVLSCAFNSLGNIILTSATDGEIRICTTEGESETMLRLRGHRAPVMDAVFSNEETCVYSCSADTTLGVWSCSWGSRVATLTGHTGAVHSVQRARCRYPIICSGSSDGTVRIWDIMAMQTVVSLNSVSEVSAACFSENSEQIFSAGNDKDIKIWDIRTAGVITRLQGHTAPVMSLALSPCGQYLLSHGLDNMLRIWDVQAYTSGIRPKLSFASNQNSAAKGLLRCAWSEDGKWVSAGTGGHDVCIWDASTGEKVRTLPGHEGHVNDVAFHPRKPIVLSVSNDKMIYLNEI